MWHQRSLRRLWRAPFDSCRRCSLQEECCRKRWAFHHGLGSVKSHRLWANLWKNPPKLKMVHSLCLIPSPSLKIQTLKGKVCLRWKGITLLGVVNKLLKTKSHPANDFNFHWRWWDWIQAIFLNIFYFKCFALLSQINFPANNLNSRWRWWDWV